MLLAFLGDGETDDTESLQAAWFATLGSFALGHTAAPPEPAGQAVPTVPTLTENTWSLPAQPGTGTLWVVLRDSRGGLDWMELPVRVN